MKYGKKLLASVLALSTLAVATTALAEPDDNYPALNPLGYYGNMSVISRLRAGNAGWSGTWANISSTTDSDYYLMTCGKLENSQGIVSSVSVEFPGSKGDLDIQVYSLEGSLIGGSYGVSDTETVGVAAAGKSAVVMKVYGFNGAQNGYGFDIVCR